MKAASPAARRGMVLLELIVALTIFACVAFGLVLALDAGMTAATERNQVDAAVRGLQNQLALIHATRIDALDQDLPVGPDGLQYHLNIQPEQLQDQNKQPLTGIYRVTIQVRWKDGSRAEERSVTQLFYQP